MGWSPLNKLALDLIQQHSPGFPIYIILQLIAKANITMLTTPCGAYAALVDLGLVPGAKVGGETGAVLGRAVASAVGDGVAKMGAIRML